MRIRKLMTALFAVSAIGMAGCGSDGGGTEPRPASLTLAMEPAPADAPSSCAAHDGLCDCPRGATAHLTLVARDASGREVAIDAGAVEWSSSDEASVGIHAAGGGADIDARRDLFDAQGAEPSATVTARYAGLEASLPVTVVLDAHGDWRADLDIGFSYSLSLAQAGRTVTDAATHYGGSVQNDTMTLTVSGITVNARFATRTDVSGTYSGPGGLHGTLTCTKQ